MAESEKLLTPVNSYGSQDSDLSSQAMLDTNEEELKRTLKYYFMSPCDKYRAKGRKPFKSLVQIIKLILVTVQLILFGLSNQIVVDFTEENMMTFKHLLKNYSDDLDDSYAVYTQTDVYECIFYTVEQQFRSFFKLKHKKDVSYTTRLEFINVWYVLLIISDMLTFVGTIMKIGIESKHHGISGVRPIELREFIAECTDAPNSGKFREVESSVCSFFCCCDRMTTYEEALLVN